MHRNDSVRMLARCASLLFFALLILACAQPRAHAQRAGLGAARFEGTWDTEAAGYKMRLRLSQNGNRVTGTYDLDGGKLEGTVSGRTLRYRWWQSSGRRGTGEFTLSEDGDSFSGPYSVTEAAGGSSQGNTWRGTRVTAATFDGTWDTESAGLKIRMQLTQTGDRVTGTYDFQNGRVEGTVSGRTLRCRWSQGAGRKGAAELTLSQDGSSFNGTYTVTEAAGGSTQGGGWSGRKVGAASFHGTWDTESAGYKIRMQLTQDGKRVTGTYDFEGGKVEGTVTGRTLRCRWSQTSGRQGEADLTLSEDGSSFTGTYTVTAAAGGSRQGGAWNGRRKTN